MQTQGQRVIMAVCLYLCLCETVCLFAQTTVCSPNVFRVGGDQKSTCLRATRVQEDNNITFFYFPSATAPPFKNPHLWIWINHLGSEDESRCLTSAAAEPSVQHHPPNYCVESHPGRTIWLCVLPGQRLWSEVGGGEKEKPALLLVCVLER